MTEGSTNERTNKRTNEHTNIRTERRKLYTPRHKCRGYKKRILLEGADVSVCGLTLWRKLKKAGKITDFGQATTTLPNAYKLIRTLVPVATNQCFTIALSILIITLTALISIAQVSLICVRPGQKPSQVYSSPGSVINGL